MYVHAIKSLFGIIVAPVDHSFDEVINDNFSLGGGGGNDCFHSAATLESCDISTRYNSPPISFPRPKIIVMLKY